MNFELTKEQALLKKAAQQFAENTLEPTAAELDETHVFPVENFKQMARYGFTGIGVPKEYGGVGGGMTEEVIAVSEFAKKCMASAATLSIHLIAPQAIAKYGTEAQKQKYLPRLTKGGELGAFALTEPGAGSDAARAQTTAILDTETNEYVLSGTKCFISGGSRAGVLVVFALTNPAAGLKGMSAIIVEAGTPGFTVGKVENKMGLRGSETAELIFEDCRVPAENLLGQEGKGFKIAMQTLDGGRIGIASQALGIMQGAIDECVKYVMERRQFGKKIGQFQNTQFELADMATKAEAAKLLVYEAAATKDAGKPYSHLSAMCKYFAGSTASDITRRCLQLFGGYGYTRDYPVERMMRDAKITEIYEGTSEVQKMVISSWMKLK